MAKTVDVSNLIDEGSWTTYQKLLIVGTALTIILDGIDNQLLGNAIPSLMKEWSLLRGAFSTALSTSPFGMMIGGVRNEAKPYTDSVYWPPTYTLPPATVGVVIFTNGPVLSRDPIWELLHNK